MSAEPSVDLVIRLGRALHAYGTSAHRLEMALGRVASRLGLQGQFFATPTAIFASFGEGEGGQAGGRTVLVRAEPGGVDLEKLTLLEEVLGDVLAGRVEAGEAARRVDAVVASPSRYGPLLSTLASALASGAAARFFGGGLREIAAAAGIGLAIGLLARLVAGRSNAGRLFEPLSAFFATAAAASLAVLTAGTSWGPIAAYIVALAGMIVLVPGLTLTIALSELGARHLVSGSARLAGAVVTFLLIGFGVALGQRVAEALLGKTPAAAPQALPAWTEAPALAVTALGLMVLFRARPRDYPWVLAGTVLALAGSRFGSGWLGAELGAFVGAFLLGLGSNLFRRVFNRPAAIPQVPGLMLLVPGSLGFRSVSALLAQDVLAGIHAAFTMTLVAVSLVTGLLIANVLAAPRGALPRSALGAGP